MVRMRFLPLRDAVQIRTETMPRDTGRTKRVRQAPHPERAEHRPTVPPNDYGRDEEMHAVDEPRTQQSGSQLASPLHEQVADTEPAERAPGGAQVEMPAAGRNGD